MPLSRRIFLRNATIGAGAAAFLNFPLAQNFASAAALPGPVRLNSNENAYGPFPSVAQAMRDSLPACNRYPDHHHQDFLARIASHHQLRPEQVITGNGSTEILRMAAQAFTGPGKKLIVAHPTFEAIGEYAAICGAEIVRLPLAANFAHDLGAMLAATRGVSGLVYICNPNNPTASITPKKDLADFVGRLPANFQLLIDDAYHHFATDSPDYASFAGNPRVIVARTFSKIYALAGLRLGYAVSSPELIGKMRPYQLQDNLNAVALRCGITGLADGASVDMAARRNAADRAAFMRQAVARNLHPIPSHANFVMMDSGRPVRDVIAHFRQNEVWIGRPFPPLETFVRVSLGLPAEMQTFWRVWDRMPKLAIS